MDKDGRRVRVGRRIGVEGACGVAKGTVSE
jgi:hypothetical protein